MSRIGKKPIRIPEGVQVSVIEGKIEVKGPRGVLCRKKPPLVAVEVGEKEIVVLRPDDSRLSRQMHGLARALIRNMVVGVSEGFSQTLSINGVGYRAGVNKSSISMSLGYSHRVDIIIPDGITVRVEGGKILLSGADNEKLGQLAATIRKQRPPEPYQGKGIKYDGEIIRRKVGKAGVS